MLTRLVILQKVKMLKLTFYLIPLAVAILVISSLFDRNQKISVKQKSGRLLAPSALEVDGNLARSTDPTFSVRVPAGFSPDIDGGGIDRKGNLYHSISALDLGNNAEALFTIFIHRTYGDDISTLAERATSYVSLVENGLTEYETDSLKGYKITYRPSFDSKSARNVYVLSKWEDYYLQIFFWNFENIPIDEDAIVHSII